MTMHIKKGKLWVADKLCLSDEV